MKVLTLKAQVYNEVLLDDISNFAILMTQRLNSKNLAHNKSLVLS